MNMGKVQVGKQFFSMWNSSSTSNIAPFPLTSTDTPGHGHIVAIITLQPFVVVARPHGAAVLVKLRSAHLAAATSIWHSAHSWRTQPGLVGALTHRWAASSHLQGTERAIIWSDKTHEIEHHGLSNSNFFFFFLETRVQKSSWGVFSALVPALHSEEELWYIHLWFCIIHTHCDWFLHACLYCKSSPCWPVSLGCLDSAEFIHSLLLARDLSHLPAPEPTCYCL